MHILVSNDDGYGAPGLVKLAKMLEKFGTVTVVAPDSNCSGASHSLTLSKTVAVRQIDERTFAVTGTPADCVHLALTGLVSQKPDLVVSGINSGQNLGEDVIYSGTVGAAMEGFISGIPSIAVSQVQRGWSCLDSAVDVTEDVIRKLLARVRKQPSLLNVNIPNLPRKELAGIVLTRLGRRQSPRPAVSTVSPRNSTAWWIGAAGDPAEAGRGTDFHAVQYNFVSVTPLKVDITSESDLEDLRSEVVF